MSSSNFFARLAVAGLFVAALVAVPSTAFAQIGTLAGKVVDTEGKPILGATVIFDNPENGLHFEAKTNAKGEWTRPGLMLTGKWVITVQKDNMNAKVPDVPIRMNSVTETPTVTLAPPKPRAGMAAIPGLDPAKKAETDKLAVETHDALEAKDYDTAIAKLNAIAVIVDKCSLCFNQIGDAYMKKGENPNAETAYLKAIEFDANAPEPYESLANIYNQQRKYDEAAKMSGKASDLKSAKTGGMMDPEAAYNAAVIAFNGSKIPEARTYLEKVLAAKPDHAEAHYLYGMVLINQNKIAEAKKELQKYIELAPTGPNVDMAKAIVAAQ